MFLGIDLEPRSLTAVVLDRDARVVSRVHTGIEPVSDAGCAGGPGLEEAWHALLAGLRQLRTANPWALAAVTRASLCGGSPMLLRHAQAGEFRSGTTIRALLRGRLTGRVVIDAAEASMTGWFDPARRYWSARALDAGEGGGSALPPVVEGTQVVGTIRAGLAATLGLQPQVSVVAGGTGETARLIALGAREPGAVVVDAGGSVRITACGGPALCTAQPAGVRCHALPGVWIAGAEAGPVLPSAPSALDAAPTSAPSGDIPFCFPAVRHDAALDPGVRAPASGDTDGGDPGPWSAGDTFVGLSPRTGALEFALSRLEARAFGVAAVLDGWIASGWVPTKVIVADGSPAESPFAEMLAAVLDRAVRRVCVTTDTAACGSAMLSQPASAEWQSGVTPAFAMPVRATASSTSRAAQRRQEWQRLNVCLHGTSAAGAHR